MRRFLVAALALLVTIPAAAAAAGGDGLLFSASLDRDFNAEHAEGDPVPNFRADVAIVANGKKGAAASWADGGYVAWKAPGNMQAARGSLGFFWRSRQPVGEAPFVIFRVGFADHSSWDMAFLRIDWNGHGFDAFVTDANLSRIRVSWRMPDLPDPTAWHHIAFGWDEAVGVRLWVDGKPVARRDQPADLDSGLDQFGLAGRVMSPHQVQSRYNFMRGSDVDELRVYDRMLDDGGAAMLAAGGSPIIPAPLVSRTAWLHRYGWDHGAPPALDAPVTRVRKVEFADAKDLKQWMWKGVDGIPETTWPGVYNRSRLPGRDDYFQLPDWNVYVQGGKRYDLTIPAGERFNRVELRGAAYGTLTWSDGGKAQTLATRPKGVVRSIDAVARHTGGVLSFINAMQEQPIQELWAYDVAAGAEPAGSFNLSYTVNASASPRLAALDGLNAFIAGRYAPAERATVLALPSSGVKAAVGAGAAGSNGVNAAIAGATPIVHVLIPASFGDAYADKPIARAWDYGWQNLSQGLDGIAIDLPPLKAKPDAKGLIALNLKVKDPIWPGRDLVDFSFSVRPGEPRTLWLDLRDRILTHDSLYLSIASASPDFGMASLDGMKVRLVFKPRADALKEHVADRLNQVKDNWGFLVEEHTASKRASLYARVFADISDLLRVDPDNALARSYWADINYRPEAAPAVVLSPIPPGVPAWAHRQLEDLALSRQFVDWWIDHRQVPYGDFGGGISDDTDLTQQWAGLALMGVKPDKLNTSLRALSDAVYRNGMITDGLGTIETDELHAYEEGLNVNAQRLYLNWGEPKAVERVMENTRALQRVILRNPAGHMHFASSWYGGRKIYRDAPWSWQKPYAFTVMHGPMLMALYNDNPAATGMVTGLIDGWLAHAKREDDGTWSFPNEINWRTDTERAGDGGGANVPYQTAWAAYRLTGDDKFLRPIDSRVTKAGAGTLGEFNDDAFAMAPQGRVWRDRLLARREDDAFSRYTRWNATGDLTALVALHEASIAYKRQRLYLMTEGHWWSDRVESAMDILQRERLGGIALVRNQPWPGHIVSWRFAEDASAERVAILLPNPSARKFRVVAFNTGGDGAADMSAWGVTAGRWSVTRSIGSDDGTTSTADGPAQVVTLERGVSVPVRFAAGKTTIYDFVLVEATTPVGERPDLGIGLDDVVMRGGKMAVTVHSLGAKPATGGRVEVVDSADRVLASVPVPDLPAPLDLQPVTTTVQMTLPRGAVAARVVPAGPEVTALNNRVALPR